MLFRSLVSNGVAEKTATTIKVEAYQPTNQHVYWGYVDNGSGNAVLYGRIDATANVWAYFQYGASIVGSISSNGSSTIYNTTSDYRLKENLKDFNGLNIVSQIKPYNFDWKSTGDSDYGVIAHELQEIFPNLVTGEKDAEDDLQRVNYIGLISLLVKEIQEIKKENIDRKKKLVDFLNLISNLRANSSARFCANSFMNDGFLVEIKRSALIARSS